MTTSYFILSAFAGASLGSFSCTFVDRLGNSSSVFRRSMCSACQHHLDALSLIPIAGFVLRRSRCHFCDARIPATYLLVETLLALIVGLTLLYYGINISALRIVVAAWVLTICTMTDLRYGIVPNKIVLAGVIAGSMLLASESIILDRFLTAPILYALAAMATGVAIRLMGHLLFNTPGMGLGDIKLFGALGLIVGVNIIPSLVVAIFLSAIVGGLGILTNRIPGNAKVPFVPFVAAAVLIVEIVTRFS